MRVWPALPRSVRWLSWLMLGALHVGCSPRAVKGQQAAPPAVSEATLLARAARSNIAPRAVAVSERSEVFVGGALTGDAEMLGAKPTTLSGAFGFVLSLSHDALRWVSAMKDYQSVKAIAVSASGHVGVTGRAPAWNELLSEVDRDTGATLWKVSSGHRGASGLATAGDRFYALIAGRRYYGAIGDFGLFGAAGPGVAQPEIPFDLSDQTNKATLVEATAVSGDGTGVFHVACRADYASSPLVSDIFVAQLDGSGHRQWVARTSGSGTADAVMLSSGARGAVVVGNVTRAKRFGQSTISVTATPTAYVAGISPDGKWRWAVHAEGGPNSRAQAVAAYPDGSVVIVGRFVGMLKLGGREIISRGKADAFAAKIDADGNVAWVKNGGGPGEDYADAVAVGPDGTAYVVGTCERAARFGPRTISADAQGLYIWPIGSDGSAGR